VHSKYNIMIICVMFDWQALWRCLHNTPDSTANVAFRVLGKFGGSNRKMLPEAQKVVVTGSSVFCKKM